MATSPDTDTVSDSGVPKEEDSNNGTEQKLISIIKYPITTSATCITDADVSDSIVTFVSPDESGTHLDALSLSSQKALVSFSDKKNTNKNSTLRARSDFYKRDQREGESISEYVSDLRRLAAECNFKGNSDESLRDRFIMGLREDDMRDTILSITNCEVTFEVAFAIAMDMEPKDNLEKESVVNKDLDDGTTSILKTEKGDEGGTFEQDVEVKVEPHEVSSIQTPGEVHPQKVYSFSKSGNSVIITVTDAHFGTTSSHEVSTVDSGSANNGGIIDDGADDNNDAFGDTECEEPSENAEYIPSVVNRTPSSVNSSGYSLSLTEQVGGTGEEGVYLQYVGQDDSSGLLYVVAAESAEGAIQNEPIKNIEESYSQDVNGNTQTHDMIIKCPSCGLYTANLSNHMETHHRNKCSICKKVFISESYLKAHERVHMKTIRCSCPYCDKPFRCTSKLQCHMRSHTIQKLSECKICHKRFKSREYLKIHARTHSRYQPHMCIFCGDQYSTASKLSEHMRSHSAVKPHKCPHCPKCFAYNAVLKMHVRLHTNERPFLCVKCGKRLISRVALYAHMKIHGNESGKTISTEEKKHICTICDKRFGKLPLLKTHIKTHSKDRIYKCPHCGKTYRASSSYRCHLKTHDEKMPLKCMECGKSYKYESSYKYHLKTHQEEKPFNCKECGKGMMSITTFKNHMKSHAMKKVRKKPTVRRKPKEGSGSAAQKVSSTQEKVPLKCEVCEKEYSSRSSLKKHMKYHGERPYQCSYCTKQFVKRSRLISHTRFHTNERPYKCSYCEKAFCEKFAKTVHERIHTGRKKYKCPLCDKEYLTNSGLRMHSKLHQRANLPQVFTIPISALPEVASYETLETQYIQVEFV